MITGSITPEREAKFEIRVLDSNREDWNVEAMLGTGFDGFLTLLPEAISTLRLRYCRTDDVTLADGRLVSLFVYEAAIRWMGRLRTVEVLQTEGGSLAGMSLLYGSRVSMDILDGGPVRIEALP